MEMELKSITVTIHYDKTLQTITGVASEDVVLSESAVFLFLLQSIFKSHPDIQKQYPPGATCAACK